MRHAFRSQTRRRLLAVTIAAAVAGGGFWALGAAGQENKKEAKSPVPVQVDKAPIERRAEDFSFSFHPIVERVTPSVVEVTTEERLKQFQGRGLPFDDPFFRFFFGPDVQPRRRGAPQRQAPVRQGLGSGVIVSPDGYILTNNHVVEGADTVRVQLGDERTLTAKVVGTDPKTDLAVIKVDAKNLPAITFADSDAVEVGDRVLAIGNPFGLGQTVTTGIVSAKGRWGATGIAYEDFIQTDAAINPGNSGGALVDMKGRLIGINTAILSRSGGFQGIGFAIPSSLARFVMDSLVQHGHVTRGYLGVQVQDLDPALAEQFGMKDDNGAAVVDVQPGTPADKAGLQRGDVIVSLNGEKVEDNRKLRFAVAAIHPGTEITLGILRDGKMQDVQLTVGELPDEAGQVGFNEGEESDEGVLNGVGVTDLTPAARREYQIPEGVDGALVTEVDPDSASATAGLRVGDVILEINHQKVESAQDAVRLTEKTESKKTLLVVWSRGGAHFLVVDESEGSSNDEDGR